MNLWISASDTEVDVTNTTAAIATDDTAPVVVSSLWNEVNDNDPKEIWSSSSSSMFLTHGQREHPLLHYCRTGQWQCILEYLDGHSNTSTTTITNNSNNGCSMTGHPVASGMEQTDVAVVSPRSTAWSLPNDSPTMDERCLQYVIRATTTTGDHPQNQYRRRQMDGTTTNIVTPDDTEEEDSSSHHQEVPSPPPPTLQQRVIETLLRHHPHLIAIVHPLTGTILHEALQYMHVNKHNHNNNNNRIIHCLLQKMILHQTQQRRQQQQQQQIPPPLVEDNVDYDHRYHRSFLGKQHNIHKDHLQRSITPTNLFQVRDDIGRTILHCLIGRWQRNLLYQYHPSNYHREDENDYRESRNRHPGSDHVHLFHTVVRVHPPQISSYDYDGYTPLLQLLQTAKTATTTLDENVPEHEIYEMLRCMIQYQPNVVMIPKRIPHYSHTYRPLPQHHHHHHHSHQDYSSNCNTGNATTTLDRNAIHTPLFYALLYGRSKPTIQLLLDTYRQIKMHGIGTIVPTYSSLILSQYQEVALHIAITTCASMEIIQCIVHDCPSSTVLYKDLYHLTPLDWLWLVYVREHSNFVLMQHHPQHPPEDDEAGDDNDDRDRGPTFQHLAVMTQRLRQIISRRRHLSDHIIKWHHTISTEQEQQLESLFYNRTNNFSMNNDENGWSPQMEHRRENSDGVTAMAWFNSIPNLVNTLLGRLQIILPSAASTLWETKQSYLSMDTMGVTTSNVLNPFDAADPKDTDACALLLHAVCYVPCPVTLIQFLLLQLYHHPNQQYAVSPIDSCHPVRHRDHIARRYPLHYAATRVSYRNTLPIGFTMSTPLTHQLNVLQEDATPVQLVAPLYPEACTQRDSYGQLPLHIVIDTYKRYRIDCYARVRRREKILMQSTTTGAEHEQHDLNEIRWYNKEEDTVIQLLIQLFPPSIHMRDGRTMLYPYQQAAVGTVGNRDIDTATAMQKNGITNGKKGNEDNDDVEVDDHGCRLTTIYQLLRLNPTLIY